MAKRSRATTGAARRIFDVARYGAAGDGQARDTAAIQKAVDACFASGGGTVCLPPGRYLSGTIVLRSNVTLRLEAGATLVGSTELADYAPRHLIYAEGAQNVTVEGPGAIDGQGHYFWYFKGWDPDFKSERQGWGEILGFWWAYRERPEQLLRLARCRDVRIRDLAIENAPAWTVHLLACDGAAIRGVTIRNPLHGGNTDGIDLDACRDVTVSDCCIVTGDDAIVLKNTDAGGLKRVSRNITVTNCVLTTTCNAFKIGTESQDGFENIAFSNSAICNAPGHPGRRALAGIAIEMVDGAHLSGVVCSNITMENVRAPIFIRLGNRGRGQPTPVPGTLRDVLIENVRASGATIPCPIVGVPGHRVEGVSLANVRITVEGGGSAEQAARQVPEREGNYPEATMFGPLPAHGFYCRHVRGLTLKNVTVEQQAPDGRPALICEDVKELEVDGLRVRPAQGGQPLLRFVGVRDALVRGCRAPTGTGTYLQVEGQESGGIVLAGNGLGSAGEAVKVTAGASAEAVRQS